MTLFVSLMIGITVYTFVYYVTMPQYMQTKNLSFYVSSQVNTSLDKENKVVTTIPNLVSLVTIGNSKAGIFNAHNSDVDVFMEDEYYNIDVEFTIQETEHNFK